MENKRVLLRESRSRAAISWLHDFRDIIGHEDQWRKLESNVTNRTTASSFDWVVPWYRHYGEIYGSPLLGIATMDGEVVGIAPLVARRSTFAMVPVSGVEFAGFNAESGEFLIADGMEELITLFFESLLDTQKVDVIMLNGFEDGSKELSVVEKFINDTHPLSEMVHGRYAVVDLKYGYDAYLSTLSSKIRNNYKRHKRNIAKEGKWEVEQVKGIVEEDVVRNAMARVFAVYDNSWKAKENGELGQPHRNFYVDIARKFAKKGLLKICFLKLNDEDIAFMIWLMDRNRCFDVKVSYDERFARLSPGILLMHEYLIMLAEENIHTIISHGDRSYKKNWASAFITRYKIFIFNKSFRSKLSYAMKFKLQPLMEKLRSNCDVRL